MYEKILNRILKFFESKSNSIGFKTSIIIVAIFSLLVSDMWTKFSYDKHLTAKFEQLKSINELRVYYRADSIRLKEIDSIENEVYERKHYTYYFRNFDLNQFTRFDASDIIDKINPIINNASSTVNKPIRSVFWMALSSSYSLISVIVVFLFLPFLGKVHREWKNIIGSLAFSIIVLGVIALITWISYKIPLIFDRPYLNYLLNFSIHTFILYIFYRISK